jgi:para-nitrobenzyl esterase
MKVTTMNSTATRRILRREFLSYGLWGIGAAASLGSRNAPAVEASSYPVVTTSYGKLRGSSRDGVAMFKGVRYGAPTGGTNRFLPPRRPAPWKGIRDALVCGNQCPQFNPWSGFAFWKDPAAHSEDCLVLNVWSPAFESRLARLPVMVWIHGGAFMAESGGSPAYDCYNLAKTGNVVVVSLNHRLNIFGYSFLAEHADERFASSGNVGQLDLVAALEWVRDNIEHFGGDPGNVTVFGESGGGQKVSTLIAMPAARGLFHKAIVQSGSFLTVGEPQSHAAATQAMYTHLSIKPGDTAALQRVPADKLVELFRKLTSDNLTASYQFSPVVDGHVIPHQTWEPRAPDYAAHIPMIIGTTAQEMAAFCSPALSEAIPDDHTLSSKAAACGLWREDPPERYQELLKTYHREMPGLSNQELLVRMSTDVTWWRPAVTQATRKIEAGGPPVFMYEFAWKTPCFGGSWALHGVDLPFTFNIMEYGPAWDGSDSAAQRAAADPQNDRYRLAAQTVAAWTSFARTGSPSTPELEWPAYDLAARSTMVFDRQTRIVTDPRATVREAVFAF